MVCSRQVSYSLDSVSLLRYVGERRREGKDGEGGGTERKRQTGSGKGGGGGGSSLHHCRSFTAWTLWVSLMYVRVTDREGVVGRVGPVEGEEGEG